MFRSAAALLLSAALALPPGPAQAQLDGSQAAQILGGLLALYGLKEALEDRDDNRKERAAPAQRQEAHRQHGPRPDRPRQLQPYAGHGRSWDRHADRWPHRDARVAPRRCERPFQGRHGWQIGYGARCMWRSVDRPRLLPDVCLREVRTPRGWRQVYPRACLRRAGWTVTAGR
ncbi:hypothetical protein [Jannaschia seohaensis]|uniref:Uncharacterized protein n=1 Tax=Jannaschia seohaensis TaxID=475081 RepID=A0A2Y9AT39_9RHOB|nr:hypothetical protein [Jannaschia seohaensis]PWJ17487.1 hypothetical protein BCF38_10697 [Jannaschia seohaensis]SSA47581.1 hypothetical protein SAMN05421539_10697 [Jannaschia seohaensis]